MYKLGHYVLSKIDPEFAHNLSIKSLKMGIYPTFKNQNTESLEPVSYTHLRAHET